jgi:hypothetical protein
MNVSSSGLRGLAGALVFSIVLLSTAQTAAQEETWADDPNVQEVLELRRLGIEAMTSTGPTASSERYSSTFVANTPSNRVVPGERLLEMFAAGTIRYDEVIQTVEYAGSHGPDMVVIMGEEVVVPGEGAEDAGRRIVRRFTDGFRREEGEWRHDLRHAKVIRVE